MPTITLNLSTFDVFVDGTHSGAIADTIKNRPELTSDIQRAVAPALASLKSASDSALKSATDKATMDVSAAKAAQKAAEDALASFRQTAGAFLQQLGSVNHPDVAVLVASGSAELAKPDNQRKAEALDAQIAALTAQKAALA